ncbi:unnamed protein product [Danaus chrysippus]|uniref:(African queen) hypothetical protein n=1 Tax=Danaus chrysippus TaxID=151541 RepID=A0A8J2W6W6_9NEOP|nr:unnamed protein product [Danaus chrysippus]
MAIDYGLGGLMVWSIDTDDFKGSCDKEADTYLDYLERYEAIKDDPVLIKALKNLKLPDANRIENLSRRTSYVAANNRLHLRLPEPEYSNYIMMRTINDATTLALEEKRIFDEMDRVARQNEVTPGDDPGASSMVYSSVLCVAMSLLALQVLV